MPFIPWPGQGRACDPRGHGRSTRRAAPSFVRYNAHCTSLLVPSARPSERGGVATTATVPPPSTHGPCRAGHAIHEVAGWPPDARHPHSRVTMRIAHHFWCQGRVLANVAVSPLRPPCRYPSTRSIREALGGPYTGVVPSSSYIIITLQYDCTCICVQVCKNKLK